MKIKKRRLIILVLLIVLAVVGFWRLDVAYNAVPETNVTARGAMLLSGFILLLMGGVAIIGVIVEVGPFLSQPEE